jgi:hypothetical protein
MANQAALEAMIASYRPVAEVEHDPASGGSLYLLNREGLLAEALAAERSKHGTTAGTIVTKLTAWEVMADAQRGGVVFS